MGASACHDEWAANPCRYLLVSSVPVSAAHTLAGPAAVKHWNILGPIGSAFMRRPRWLRIEVSSGEDYSVRLRAGRHARDQSPPRASGNGLLDL